MQLLQTLDRNLQYRAIDWDDVRHFMTNTDKSEARCHLKSTL